MVVGGARGTGLANDAGIVTAQVVEGAVAGVYVPVAGGARVLDGYARTWRGHHGNGHCKNEINMSIIMMMMMMIMIMYIYHAIINALAECSHDTY